MSGQQSSQYNPPFLLKNGHLQTIYPHLFRKFDISFYERERIHTTDKDFLDLDWALKGSEKLAIISHGLEGSSYRPYVVGMVHALNQAGWDALAWNYRSCSGEINRTLRFYHNGATDDLVCVIENAISKNRYNKIALIGFSMGGNLSLMYLGQYREQLHDRISKAIVFSVPCHLKSSAQTLARPINKLYMRRFLNQLHQKIRKKMMLFPGQIDDKGYNEITNFKEFDDRYTAPIHGFKDAEDYWQKCSSLQYISRIRINTLIINAANDPFLSKQCYPLKATEQNRYVKLEIPISGGHAGFVLFNPEKRYWSELRAVQFLDQE